MEEVRVAHASSNIALTAAELEEEALLLLIREQLESRSKSKATSRVKEKQPFASVGASSRRPGASSAQAQARSKYKCFQDDGLFLQSLLQEDAEGKDDAGPPECDDDDHAASVNARELASQPSGDAAEQVRSKQHKPAVPALKVPRSIKVWRRNICSSLASILDRFHRCQKGIGYNEEVSLLVTLPRELQAEDCDTLVNGEDDQSLELVCVVWTDVQKREGRPTRIDSMNRVVWAPSHLFGKQVPSQHYPLTKYADILHASGAQSRKVKSTLRDSLPEAVTRFMALVRLICSYANHEPHNLKQYLTYVCKGFLSLMYSLVCKFK